jgi:hypothetical protein
MQKYLVEYLRRDDRTPVGVVVAVDVDKIGVAYHYSKAKKFDRELLIAYALKRAIDGTDVPVPYFIDNSNKRLEIVGSAIERMKVRAEKYFKKPGDFLFDSMNTKVSRFTQRVIIGYGGQGYYGFLEPNNVYISKDNEWVEVTDKNIDSLYFKTKEDVITAITGSFGFTIGEGLAFELCTDSDKSLYYNENTGNFSYSEYLNNHETICASLEKHGYKILAELLKDFGY